MLDIKVKTMNYIYKCRLCGREHTIETDVNSNIAIPDARRRVDQNIKMVSLHACDEPGQIGVTDFIGIVE